MTKKSFKQIYDELPPTPPKTAFIKRIAELTKKTEFTVKMWLGGRQVPDELTQDVIARELKVPAKELFPEVVIS